MDAVARIALALALLASACVLDSKETVELPARTSDLAPVFVTALAEPTDARNVVVAGGRLFVADATGLLIYSTANPAAPTLLATLSEPVDHVAVLRDVAYTIALDGDRLRGWDVSDPTNIVMQSDVRSLTRTFGALAVMPNLVWHAVGSSPPSRLYYGGGPITRERSCEADDRERGSMGIWLYPNFAVASLHFDDYGGDGIDGNGGFGFLLFSVNGVGQRCPDVEQTDLILTPSHSLNRSRFEADSNSDLQVDFDSAARDLYTTGEQRVRRYRVSSLGAATLAAEIAIPEVLDVAFDASGARSVLGVANGDFGLVEVTATGELEFAGLVETSGVARATVAAGDGTHFYVADGEGGVVVISFGVAP